MIRSITANPLPDGNEWLEVWLETANPLPDGNEWLEVLPQTHYLMVTNYWKYYRKPLTWW